MRFDYSNKTPDAVRGLVEVEKYVRGSGIEHSLHELVKMRASQINGCAYCMDMHAKDARKAGESEQRIYALTAWRETSFFSERERAALEWTEALTLISQNHVSDELYNKVRSQFSENELMALSMAVVSINGWNRLAISFKKEPGLYQPK